ncbi:MAG: GNAT family N-acetyltransferase [Cyanobacteria bacterium J06639_1]
MTDDIAVNFPSAASTPDDRGRPDNRHVRFSADETEVDIDQLKSLFDRNAFWAVDRDRADLETAIARSFPVVTVWNGDSLIGFARATSDGIYRAVIWDVVIDSRYRKQGLGQKLVETLISHPELQQIERVYLFTTHQKGFYERIGFQANTSTTMVLMGKSLELLLPLDTHQSSSRSL